MPAFWRRWPRFLDLIPRFWNDIPGFWPEIPPFPRLFPKRQASSTEFSIAISSANNAPYDPRQRYKTAAIEIGASRKAATKIVRIPP